MVSAAGPVTRTSPRSQRSAWGYNLIRAVGERVNSIPKTEDSEPFHYNRAPLFKEVPSQQRAQQVPPCSFSSSPSPQSWPSLSDSSTLFNLRIDAQRQPRRRLPHRVRFQTLLIDAPKEWMNAKKQEGNLPNGVNVISSSDAVLRLLQFGAPIR